MDAVGLWVMSCFLSSLKTLVSMIYFIQSAMRPFIPFERSLMSASEDNNLGVLLHSQTNERHIPWRII